VVDVNVKMGWVRKPRTGEGYPNQTDVEYWHNAVCWHGKEEGLHETTSMPSPVPPTSDQAAVDRAMIY